MSGSGERLLCIVGPTASGKSALALGLARELGGEILSADSMQVYRGFDIGTGKPSAVERAQVPHHLLDVADPLDTWDAARWATRATELVREIRARGRLPIVCGGSFLWVKALVYGLAEAPRADEAIRARHRQLVSELGRAALHAKLAEVDPASAARLAPNDFVRVSRALEVFELGGVPQSQVHAAHGFRQAVFAPRMIGVRREPAELDRLITERVASMLRAGWAAEVKRLLEAGYGASRAMGSVGYKQLSAHADLGEPALLELIVRATRIFARRQRTWLRDQPVEWLPEGATKLP